jgi:hypothetical protein
VIVVRRTVTLAIVALLGLAVVAGSAGATAATEPPPPPGIPTMPKGHQTSCTMTGPAWAAYGVHTPNAAPRRGNHYLVHAWGIPCSTAMNLLRALARTIPAHRAGTISGAPAGFHCKSSASGSTKNRLYEVACLRRAPAATFDWQAVGGKV